MVRVRAEVKVKVGGGALRLVPAARQGDYYTHPYTYDCTHLPLVGAVKELRVLYEVGHVVGRVVQLLLRAG